MASAPATQSTATTPRIAGLLDAMHAICPLALAESWDNVGLLLGAPDDPIRGPALVTLDLTHAVIDEADALGSSAVICYHPPIFEPLGRLASDHPRQALILRAARAGLSLVSPHTALDAAPGGLADWLADACLDPGAPRPADRRALRAHAALAPTEEVKVVTFVPEASLDAVRQGLASAGAGLIGAYELCSFAIPGTGTFLARPGSGANPAVGEVGRFEAVPEHRLEMVCSRRALPLALATLRRLHPYEEPAIDVVPLEGKPRREAGPGRRLLLDRPVTPAALAARLRAALGLPDIGLATADGRDAGPAASTIGVCPGSGGDLWPVARAEGCEVYVTGEMKHHEVLAATMAGLSLILAGHTQTERGYLPTFARRLGEAMNAVTFRVSERDRDPVSSL
jgi:dinuclear metal center YbgI/SA1388 family protein